MKPNRRQFLHAAGSASLLTATSPLVRAAPRTRKYRTALIGSGWWGMNLLAEAVAAGRSKVVALCDVDETALESTADQLSDLTADSPKQYRDYRELFEKENVEIAIIASPDHWHALNTIEALRAGAHVFVEKPTGHTIGESRAMLDVARQTERTVQVGLHRRIGPHHVAAMEFLKSGNVGDVGMVRMFAHGGGGIEKPTRNSDVPQGLDWDMYLGPAPERPFNRRIHPGGFRNFLDFANGTLGDWGVHWLDQVLWWTDEKYPREVYSTGGRPVRGEAVLNETEQTSDAPDSQVAVYKFESFTATWEHRKFAGNSAEKHRIGCYYYGDKGTLHVGWRDGWTFYPAKGGNPTHGDSQLQEPDGHNIKLLWADFIDSIDKHRRPVADAEVGHLATNLSLLGMISYKLGRSIEWDGAKEVIPGDGEANALLRREYRGPWEYPTA